MYMDDCSVYFLAIEDRSKITNAACGITISEQLRTADLSIENVLPSVERGFSITFGEESLSKWDFFKESLKKINQLNDRTFLTRRLEVGAALLNPIDSENDFKIIVDGDVKTVKGEIKVSVVPDALKVFHP
uniref:Uncharacterized protein n=1 Tax=Romanomermis culicivorax TaxID=13658 RepID=A0A915HJ17_ROMCU